MQLNNQPLPTIKSQTVLNHIPIFPHLARKIQPKIFNSRAYYKWKWNILEKLPCEIKSLESPGEIAVIPVTSQLENFQLSRIDECSISRRKLLYILEFWIFWSRWKLRFATVMTGTSLSSLNMGNSISSINNPSRINYPYDFLKHFYHKHWRNLMIACVNNFCKIILPLSLH